MSFDVSPGEIFFGNLNEGLIKILSVSKADIEELTGMINQLRQEIASLKKSTPKPAVRKKKKA